MSHSRSENNKIYLRLVLMGVIFYTIIFTSLCSLRYRAFFSYEWEDEAAENQILWNTVHGSFLKQTIYETESGMFIDHFSPIYILISFLYAVVPRIHTLYFLISFSFAIGAISLFLLAREILADSFQACLFAFTYLFYSPLHWINVTTVEPIMFSIPLLLFAFYFFYKGRFWHFLILLILSLMTKGNISLIIIMFGLYALIKKKDSKWILLPLSFGIVWYVLSIWVAYPAIGSPNRSPFHGLLFGSPSGILRNFILSPGKILNFMFSYEHLLFLAKVFKPILFLSFFSLEWLISLPTYLQILLITELPGNNWSYSLSPAIPFIFLGLIFSLQYIKRLIWSSANLRNEIKTALMNCLVICVMGSSILSNFGSNMIGFLNDHKIVDRRFESIDNIYDMRLYLSDTDDEIAWDLINRIPKDAPVSASGDLLVPLSHRPKLLEFSFDSVADGGGQDYYDVDYILIHKKSVQHGGGQYAPLRKKHLDKIVELIDKYVFTVIAERGDFILLKKVE